MDAIEYILLGIGLGFGFRSWQWRRSRKAVHFSPGNIRVSGISPDQVAAIREQVSAAQRETVQNITKHLSAINAASRHYAA